MTGPAGAAARRLTGEPDATYQQASALSDRRVGVGGVRGDAADLPAV